MTVVLPPVEANLFSLVDRTDQQANANREELDFSERHLDVARDNETLVEHAIENVDQPGIAAGGTPCQVGRHAEKGIRWLLVARSRTRRPTRSSREPSQYSSRESAHQHDGAQ